MKIRKLRIKPGLEFIFTSPYDQYKDRIGQRATIIRKVYKSEVDVEVGPMYVALFESDAELIWVWPEEIDPSLMLGAKNG